LKQSGIEASSFVPALGLRNTHTQSLINSSAYRRRIVRKRSKAMLDAERDWILDGGDDVRLLGHYSPQAGDSKGLAVLFHGWEGSSRSNYVVAAGGMLYDHGFDVFRLNFRDHGETHHMNPGLFHSCRLGEVVHALQDVQRRTGARNWALSGYSLGGNFALRVAMSAPEAGLSLRRVVAVCPVISPSNTLDAMETGPRGYESYFIRKWAKSIRVKQSLFPDTCEYEAWYKLKNLRERTGYLATRYYDFATLEQYFDGYSVAGDRLKKISVPTTILTSEDDMVVPVSDFKDLPDNDNIELMVTRYGGHCAFLKNWKMESFADDVIVKRVLEDRSESQ